MYLWWLFVAKHNYSVLATAAGLLPKLELYSHPPTSDQASVYTELLFTLHHTLHFALHGRWVTLHSSLITAPCDVQ